MASCCGGCREGGLAGSGRSVAAVIARLRSRKGDVGANLFVITREISPRITARHPQATVEDSYAIQSAWRDKQLAAGRRLVGRKIGLTSKAMQAATGITEPDYGVILNDTVWDGAAIPFDNFSNVRIEVELAFLLRDP